MDVIKNGVTISETQLQKLKSESQVLLENKKYELALDNYKTLIDINGIDEAAIYLKKARCHMNLKQYDQAFSNAKHTLKMEPLNLEACIVCGQAATELCLFEEALGYFQEGLKVDSKNKTITSNLKELHAKILDDYKDKGNSAESTYSAVKFCSQDPYPGDSELLTLEYEILEKKYKIPKEDKVNFDDINKEAAAKHAALAFRIRNQNLDDAIRECTSAITKDPTNIMYRQLRGDMLLAKEDSLDALADFWTIPKQNRTYDVWLAGGRILNELQLPVCAEFWFRRATKQSQPDDDEAAHLFQKVRVNRLYSPLTKDYPVKVEFRQFGRAIYATKDIKQGEVAFVDSPVVRAQILTSANKVKACSHCARSLLTAADYFGENLDTMSVEEKKLVEQHWPDVTPIYCECNRIYYCSDDCRLEAWDLYHQIICLNLNPASKELYDLLDNDGWGFRDDGSKGEIWGGHYSVMVLANIWASIIMEAKRLMKKEGLATPSVSNWAKAKAPYRRFIAYGTTPATSRMPDMLPVFQRVFKHTGDNDGVVFDVTAEEFNGRYYQATCNLQEFSALVTPYHIFLTKLSSDFRGLQMIKYLEKSPPYAGFCGMFSLHACLNHSCCNNVECIDGDCDDKPGVNVVAKRFIKAGEELFTTYIDTKLPKNIRRAWLYKSFNFWCQCRKCQYEGEDKHACTHCNIKSEKKQAFPCCSKCKQAWYCSVKCQKESWKRGHKTICNIKNSEVCK